MGENVEFASNGDKASGYLATAKEGAGPGMIVVRGVGPGECRLGVL